MDRFRFSSEDLPQAERIPFYRDVVWQMMASLEVEPVDEEFSCKTHFICLPNLVVAYVAGSSVRARWTHIKAEPEKGPRLVLVMNLFGAGRLAHLGREATVAAGSSILFSSADASRMERSKSRFLLIGMPRKELVPMLTDPDAAMMSVVRNTIEPLRLLPAYIDLLIKEPALLEVAELRRLAVDHIHDLVALTVGATRDAAEIAAGRGLRAGRLRAIKADIAQNIAGDVTVAALSARHRLSERYVRKLFEGEDTPLSQFVLGERLIRVHRRFESELEAAAAPVAVPFAVAALAPFPVAVLTAAPLAAVAEARSGRSESEIEAAAAPVAVAPTVAALAPFPVAELTAAAFASLHLLHHGVRAGDLVSERKRLRGVHSQADGERRGGHRRCP
jgi:AraC-like DNA-binding protein